MTSQYNKAPLDALRFARNGFYPDAYMAAELADHINHAALFRLQEVASFAVTVPAAGGYDRMRHQFVFRSSAYANAIVVLAALTPVAIENGDSPYVRVRIIEDDPIAGPTVLGDAQVAYGAAGAITNTPNDLGILMGYVQSTPGTLAVIPGNAELYGEISEQEGARLHSITVFELAKDVTPPMTEGLALGRPIFDKDRQDAVTAARAMWKQGRKLFTWSVDLPTSPKTRSAGAPVHLIDGASSVAAATVPGMVFDLRQKTTERRVTVPVVLWVYAKTTAGIGGSFYLRDSSNNVVASIHGITTEGWYATTIDLPATKDTYHMFFSGDGTNVLSVYYACAYQFASGT